MKEPSRRNKLTSSSQQKLKLLCSFNGSFLPRTASRKLCYLGGETRLISVDRSIGYSQLLSKISELCPKLSSLSLKYQLPDSDDDGLYGDLPLVSIETDDDVRCMIEEYDKVADGRRRAKLRIFVCSGGNRHRSGPKTSVARMAGPGSQSKALSGRFRRGWALEDGFASANCHQLVGIVRFPYVAYQCNLCPAMRNFNHLDCNRENIRPSNASNNQMKSCLLPVAHNNQMDREVYPYCSPVRNYAISGFPHEIGNIQTGFSSARNCRNRLHDIGNHQYSGFGQRYGGCYPGLKPMLSTSEFQQRSNYAHLAKILGGYSKNRMFETANMGGNGKEARSLFNVENSRGILRERVLQPRYEKTLLSHFYGWSDLQENHLDSYRVYCGPLEAGKQHHHLGNCSCLLCDATEKPIPCFAPGYREDQPCYSNFEKCEPQSSSLLNKSFKNAFCNIKVGEGGCQYPITIDDLPSPCSQEIEAGLAWRTLEEVAKEPRDGHDRHDETSVDLSVHKLSSSSSSYTEVATPKIFCLYINDLGTDGDQPMYGESTTHNSNISAQDDASARCEMLPPFTPSDTMDEGHQNMELIMENLTEVQNHKTDSDASSCNTSMMDAAELKLSGPCSPVVAEVSSSMGRDLAHEEENQLNASSSFKSKEKANLKGSACKAEVVGETTSKLTACYAHLTTQELQTIKNSDLEEIRELGSGTYGTVFYGKWKGCDVAIKRIKPSCFSVDEHGQDQLIADFWKEATLLSQLHHPNVVSFYGVVTDGPPNNLSTVTEYMVNGSLKQVLQKKDRTIDRRKRVMIAMDAAFGMEYLHEKNIVHFDLKSHNFLVNMRYPQRPVCKIGDLGLSKVKQKTYVSGGVRGTLPWMAPELLKSKSNLVTEKVDVFSFGIVMWELLAVDEPYAGMCSEEIIAGIIRGDLRPEIPSWCDPAWRSLMERCWSSDPASRPSFFEIAKELRAIAASMNIK